MPIFSFALKGFCVDVAGAAHLLKHVEAPNREAVELWLKESGDLRPYIDKTVSVMDLGDTVHEVEVLIEDHDGLPSNDEFDWTWFARVPAPTEKDPKKHTGLYYRDLDELQQDLVPRWVDEIVQAAEWYAKHWFEPSSLEGKTDAEIKAIEDEALANIPKET